MSDNMGGAKRLWRRYRPQLAMMLDLGFLRFQTHVMYESIEMYVFEYLTLDWQLLKWRGSFRLSLPRERWHR